LLIERKFGDHQQAAALCDQIVAAQRLEGGWRWQAHCSMSSRRHRTNGDELLLRLVERLDFRGGVLRRRCL
jgi:hypothetical protein